MKNALAAIWAAATARRRDPTVGELTTGMQAGIADSRLFNELLYRASGMEAELVHLLVYAMANAAGRAALDNGLPLGAAPSEANLQQVRKALQAMFVEKAVGASTEKAPKLSGIVATGLAAVTSIPTSVATILPYPATDQSNLSTSTWDGTTLTVGAGEAGLWLVSASVHFALASAGAYSSVGIYRNGLEIALGASQSGNAGDAASPSTATIIKCNAGDTLAAYAYQQTGSTKNTSGTTRTRFAAFLISSY
ncbi:hypothetical protein [Salinarimonas soli]|uniref:Uncharacterized protein n=1 Tax=Salinarimonas soli TaxID=1638099 RepID=A0A5B2VGL6_9HYPH|nr:hypothetical protein [Salinarimonas soli]KAA2237660.1 hypothetical protein F0L46_08240 [Salinarimonas soli]